MKFKTILMTTAALFSLGLLASCSSGSTSRPPSSDAKPAAQTNPALYRNFYEIFSGSFADSNGDGEGDLNGITQHLDYLNTGKAGSTTDLKVNGIWLTPIFPTSTYHGYDVINYEAINPKMGTMSDFENLIVQSKKRGIAVILDMVFNHTSDKNPWFQKALAGDKKYQAYYNWSDTPKLGYDLASNGKYYEAEFDKSMPDLNLANPDVKRELAAITKFWLDKGVDGFRPDATGFYFSKDAAGSMVTDFSKTVPFLKWLVTSVKSQDKNAYIVGEDFSSGSDITDMYASGIDSLFNFPNAIQNNSSPLANAMLLGEGTEFADQTAQWDSDIHKANPTAIDAPFLSNHDTDRSSSVYSTLERQKMAAQTYLLMPGNPFIYYGEEIGLTGNNSSDENKRLPMQWTANGQGSPKALAAATMTATTDGGPVDQQEQNPNSLLNWYKKILRIKAKYPEIASGRLKALDTSKDNLSILNYGQSLTIINNFDEKATSTLTLPKGTNGQTIAETLSVAGGTAQLDNGKLTIPPFTTVILK